MRNTIFSENLRKRRIEKGLVQQDLAKTFGISSVAYGAWERGETEPSIANLAKLCRVLGVSADWLIGLDQSRTEQKPLITARISALKSEADQAAATLARLLTQIGEMEKSV